MSEKRSGLSDTMPRLVAALRQLLHAHARQRAANVRLTIQQRQAMLVAAAMSKKKLQEYADGQREAATGMGKPHP